MNRLSKNRYTPNGVIEKHVVPKLFCWKIEAPNKLYRTKLGMVPQWMFIIISMNEGGQYHDAFIPYSL